MICYNEYALSFIYVAFKSPRVMDILSVLSFIGQRKDLSYVWVIGKGFYLYYHIDDDTEIYCVENDLIPFLNFIKRK